MLFYLIAAHFVADYPLQSDAMASCKCRGSGHAAAKSVPWYYWLTAHAVIHGAAVGLVLKLYGVAEPMMLALVAAETIVHWFIDLGKCSKLYSIHVDQGLHVLCKVGWYLIATAPAV